MKTRIQRHYDVCAPLYRRLWGVHIHHGYWRYGTESKEVAQEQLTAVLAASTGIRGGSRILDIGCGFGGSDEYLAQHYGANVLGISLSEKQIQVAAVMAKAEPALQFVVMDAEQLGIAGKFDVVWSIEAISHLSNKRDVLRHAADLLVPNGRIALMDWFKSDRLSRREEERYISPIVDRMLLPELNTIPEYVNALERAGCRMVEVQDISSRVARTWDLCLDIIRLPFVWRFALSQGKEFVSFLHGFAAMRDGFRSGALRFGMLVAEKCAS